MDKTAIIERIKTNLLDILPDLKEETLDVNERFTNMGANSIDRADLIAMTLEDMDLDIPIFKLAEAKTIDELADQLLKHSNA